MKVRVAVTIVGGLIIGGAAIAYLAATDRVPYLSSEPTPTPSHRHPFETALTAEFVNDHRHEIIDILADTLKGHVEPDMLEERILDWMVWIGHGEMSDGRVKLDVIAPVGGVGASVTIYLTLGKDSVTSWEVEEARLIDNRDNRKEKR